MSDSDWKREWRGLREVEEALERRRTLLLFAAALGLGCFSTLGAALLFGAL